MYAETGFVKVEGAVVEYSGEAGRRNVQMDAVWQPQEPQRSSEESQSSLASLGALGVARSRGTDS